MGELGSGSGSSYPGALDTDSTLEVNSPAAGKTKVKAEGINDANAAIIKIETELGTDPAGSLTDVKTYLQTEHGTDGTHDNTKVAMLAGPQTFSGVKTFSEEIISSAAVDSPPVANGLYKGNIVKGWLNYDHASATINNSFNVSSVTDIGTGTFEVTINTDFATADYAAVPSSEAHHTQLASTSFAVGSFRVQTKDSANNATDAAQATVIFIGDQ